MLLFPNTTGLPGTLYHFEDATVHSYLDGVHRTRSWEFRAQDYLYTERLFMLNSLVLIAISFQLFLLNEHVLKTV